MKYTLSKNLRFESAHRLAKGYEGKCANIHGHSWNGKIEVECMKLNEYDMGVDFKVLGDFCVYISSQLDHKILLYKKDLDLILFCKQNGYEEVEFEDNPTCEIISKWIYDEAIRFFAPRKIQVKSVTINETCTTACTYER